MYRVLPALVGKCISAETRLRSGGKRQKTGWNKKKYRPARRAERWPGEGETAAVQALLSSATFPPPQATPRLRGGGGNALRKLLRIPNSRRKAGFSVCWLCSTVFVFVSERVLTETERNAQGVNFSKSLLTFVWFLFLFLFFVTWKFLWN